MSEKEKRFEALRDDSDWEEITTEDDRPYTPWVPEEIGEEIRGFYLGLRELTASDGSKFEKHLFEDEDVIWAVNNNAVLSNALRGVEEGTAVKIKYLGTRRSKRGWTYKDYNVKIKRI